MAKFIFLVCILAALVHENLSKPSSHARVRRSELDDCIATLELPAIMNTPEMRGLREDGKSQICQLKGFALVNDDNTVNQENVTRFISEKFMADSPNYGKAAEKFKECGKSAADANTNGTKLDVYGTWLKCIFETRDVTFHIKDI